MDAQASSSGSVFSPGDYINLRYNHFVKKYGKKTTNLVMMRLLFPSVQHRSIREILIDVEVPLQGKRCLFNSQEIKNITEKSPEDLDITVMNKILQVLWQKGVNDPGDELKVLLKKIRDERNFVSHEEPLMSDTDLEHKLRSFQVMIEETLEKTKSLFPNHSAAIDDLKAEVQDAVPKILEKIREKYDPSNPQDQQRLHNEIEEFGSELSDMIQKSSEAELLPLNERFSQILLYDWLAQYGTTDPGKIMVSLQVADDPELNRSHNGNKSIIVNQNEILNIKDKMGRDPEVLIICGDAGSGKTTILCSYAEGWCKKANDMPELLSFQLLLCMQFRSHNPDNFDDYLKRLIPKTAALFPFDCVKSAVLDSKCLVLCDGYDEANWKSKNLFEDMLDLNSNKMKFVVTTRPGNSEELTKIVNKAKRSKFNLKVSGLREEDMKSLTEKLIGHLVKDDVTQQEQMKKELLQKIEEMNTGTRAILQTPLYFNLFVLLYIECPDLRDEMSTRTSVYLQLRRHKIKRISDETGISEQLLEKFDALYRKWCLKHYIEKNYQFSETEVRSFEEEIRQALPEKVLQNFDAIMSSYFSMKKTKKYLDIEKVYCHRHRSEQEFAAAGSICDDIITSSGRTLEGNIVRNVLLSKFLGEDNDGDEDEEENKVERVFEEYGEVTSFIPGILYNTKINVLYDTIDEIHELYALFRVFGDDDYVEEYDGVHRGHDALLDPCIETRLDHKVLESLVSQMKKTSLNDKVIFQETKSLYVLPSLLPKLRPTHILFRFSPSTGIIVSTFTETLSVASELNIHTSIAIGTYLSGYARLSGQEEVLCPVDELKLVIVDDGYEDLESLQRPLSLATPPKRLGLEYFMRDAPEGRDVAKLINRTFPTIRESGGEGANDLWILLHSDPTDIKLLLQTLTVAPPLRKITILLPSGTGMDEDLEELKQLCKNKRVKYLHVYNGTHEVQVNADREEEEEDKQQQEAEERKREEGKNEEGEEE